MTFLFSRNWGNFVITFLNFDGSSVGILPAGFANTSTIPGHTGNFQVGTTGSISSPNGLYDAGGQSGGSAIWTNFLAADQAIQFDQVVNLSGGVMNPLIRMSLNGQTGYGAFINWSTPKIDFVAIAIGGVITTLSSPAIPSFSNGAQVTVKLEVQGSTLRFKAWLSGTTEPASWTASTTDGTYTSAGYAGFSSNGGTADNVYFGPAESTFSGGFLAPVLSSGTLTSSSAQLNWNAAGQSGGPTSYQLLRSIHGANAFSSIPGATLSPSIDPAVTASTSYDYKVTATDGVNATVSSNVLTLTIPAPPAATSFTINGPPSGMVGQLSSPFTITPNGQYSGTITITPAGCGLSTPVVLTFSSSTSSQTFHLTPALTGTVTLTPSNNGGLVNPSPRTYLAATTATFYSFSGPTVGVSGIGSSTFTVAPNGPFTGTITITPNGCGLSTPLVFTFASSSTPQTFTITPLSSGTVTLTPTNSGGLPNADPVNYVAASISPTIEGSGEMLKLTFLDESGSPSNVTAIASTNDIQTVSLGGFPSGDQFTLTFNGQTTSTITVDAVLPASYALFTVPVTPGVPVQVAVDQQNYSSLCNNILVSLIDGQTGSLVGPTLATNIVNEYNGTYDYSATAGGNTINFKIIATVTPSTSTLLILYTLTGVPTEPQIQLPIVAIQCCAVKVVSTGVSSYYGVHDAQFSHTASGVIQSQPSGYNGYQINVINYSGNGLPFSFGGTLPYLSASALQSALTALSSVGSGNLTVVDQSGSGGVGPYTITSVGALANTDVPLMTSSDPAVTIVHTIVGGQLPTITVNGGSPIRLTGMMVWGNGQFGDSGTVDVLTQPYSPSVLIPFPQSSPALTYVPIGSSPFTASDYSWYFDYPHGYSGAASTSTNATSTFTVLFEGYLAGTYQISMTWPTLSGLGSAVPVTISDSTGNVLTTAIVNQSAAPSGINDQGVGWTILGSFTIAYPATGFQVVVTVPSGGGACVDAFRIARTSADVSLTIEPGDTVTATIPGNLFSTASGVFGGVTNMAVTNCAGSNSLPSFVSDPKTMGVGFNVVANDSILPAFMTSNLADRLDLSGGTNVLDANGNPVSSTQSSLSDTVMLLCGVYPYSQLSGMNFAPTGLYTLKWNGQSNLVINGSNENAETTVTTEETSYRILNGASGNQRVYNLQCVSEVAISPSVNIQFFPVSGPDENGVYTYDVTDIEVYPPNPSDPTGMTPWLTGQPYWHPNFLGMLAGAKSIRFMDYMGINLMNIGDYSDFRVEGSLGSPTRFVSVPISQIEQAPTPWFAPSQVPSVLITTATPHGMPKVSVPSITISGSIEWSNGNAAYGPGTYSSLAVAINATQIQMTFLFLENEPATMTNVLTSGTLSFVLGGETGVFTRMFDLCNQVGADCWMNIPYGASDACIGSMFTAALALNPGLKLRMEFGNECWNYAFAGTKYLDHYAYNLTGTFGSAHETGMVYLSQQAWNLGYAIWEAAGRADDLVWVMGTQGADPGATSAICDSATTYSAAFHELATAPYVNNNTLSPVYGPEVTFQEFYDTATFGQCSDYLDDVIEYRGAEGVYVTAHKAVLTSSGFPDVNLVFYEGGYQALIPGYSAVNGFDRTYAIVFHPRIKATTLRMFQKFEDAGVTLFNLYYLFGAGFIGNNSGPLSGRYPSAWAVYIGWNQPAGTGNWTTDATNISQFKNLAVVKSEVGGAVKTWNALVPSPRIGGSAESGRQMKAIGQSTHGGKHY